MRLATLSAAALVAGCCPVVSSTVVPPPPEPAAAAAFAGAWHWRHGEERPGARVVERESWQLRADGDAVRGSYRRRVEVRSTDGAPFACSQSPGYVLDARYEVAGRVVAGRLALREVAVEVAPSPCEPGERALGAYRGRLEHGELVVAFAGGAQRLRRGPGPALPWPAPQPLTGRWRWSHESRDPRTGAVRTERETWTLAETESGQVTGHYERRVSAVDPTGAPIPCAQSPSWELVDRYEVRGTRRGARVTLAEIGVDAAAHPCAGERRHLGSARGRITGDTLELRWRGRLRQVLHRDHSVAYRTRK